MAKIKVLTGTGWQELSSTAPTSGAPGGFAVQAPTNLAYIPYLKKMGINAVRLGGIQFSPWGIYWGNAVRDAAIAYKKAGFWVQYDISSATGGGFTNPITASVWPIFHDVCVAEATFLQSKGIQFDLLGLGNELENLVDNSTLTYQGLYDRLQTLATDVKAVYSGKVSYNYFNWPLTAYQGWDPSVGWRTGGAGNFDLVAVHPYATITPPVIPSPGTFVNALWVSKTPSADIPYSVGFNGTSCKVDLGQPSGLATLTDFTWAGWVNAAEAKKTCLWSNFFNFPSNLGQGIYLGVTIVNSVSQPSVQVFQGSAGAVSGRPAYSVGQWFYLVVKQVGNTVNCWINGTQILLSPPAGGNTVVDTPLTQVGQDATKNSFFGMESGTAFPFSGEMYRVGIWNRGLTTEEIAGLMGGTYPSSGLINQYLYPSSTITPATIDFTKINLILSSWYAQFGNRLYISEFNLDADGFHIATLTRQQQKDYMTTMFTAMQTARNGANAAGVDNKLIYFKFNGESMQLGTASGYGFNLANIDGTTNGMMDAIMGNPNG